MTMRHLKRLIRIGTIEGKLVPMFCGTAFKNKGVQPLLDAVVDYLPSPLDIPAIKGIDVKTGEETTRRAADDEPLSLLAFKIMNDPFVGTLDILPFVFRCARNRHDLDEYGQRKARTRWSHVDYALQ